MEFYRVLQVKFFTESPWDSTWLFHHVEINGGIFHGITPFLECYRSCVSLYRLRAFLFSNAI